jgi:hypothetical protein
MKPDLDFDDELKLKSSRCWLPVRSIWLLMLLVAVSAATTTIIAGVFRHPISAKYTTGARMPIATLPVLIPADLPRDPFVITADASIDPKMVVSAPLGIDEAMVFNPDDHGGLRPLFPGPEFMPVPDQVPRWYGPPQPR